jgi:hypothetical protein
LLLDKRFEQDLGTVVEQHAFEVLSARDRKRRLPERRLEPLGFGHLGHADVVHGRNRVRLAGGVVRPLLETHPGVAAPLVGRSAE